MVKLIQEYFGITPGVGNRSAIWFHKCCQIPGCGTFLPFPYTSSCHSWCLTRFVIDHVGVGRYIFESSGLVPVPLISWAVKTANTDFLIWLSQYVSCYPETMMAAFLRANTVTLASTKFILSLNHDEIPNRILTPILFSDMNGEYYEDIFPILDLLFADERFQFDPKWFRSNLPIPLFEYFYTKLDTSDDKLMEELLEGAILKNEPVLAQKFWEKRHYSPKFLSQLLDAAIENKFLKRYPLVPFPSFTSSCLVTDNICHDCFQAGFILLTQPFVNFL